MVFSFDIFDTLLTRRSGGPCSVFLLMGADLVRDGSLTTTPPAFSSARVSAEARAMSALGRDPTINEIYAELAHALGKPAPYADDWAAMEMRLQESVLEPVAEHVQLVADARRNGRVIFVSDMYLPSRFLGSLLVKHGIGDSSDQIYVSCEHGASKRHGTLFPKILREEGIAPAALLHHGDDPDGDDRMPRRCGCRTRPLTAARFSRYEATIDSMADTTDSVAGAFAGASRAARLRLMASHRASPIEVVGTGVAGPLLTAYVTWVLKTAMHRKLQRLYFLARDGEILVRIAKQLCSAWKLPLDCRYIYASRQAWHLPSVREIGPAERSWLLEGSDVSSVRQILARVSIDPSELAADLTKAGFHHNNWDDVLDEPTRKRLGDVLSQPCAVSRVLRKSASARAIALRYLESVGMLDGTPWGIVDLGWRGRLQRSLMSILAERPPTKILGFYMGLSAEADPSSAPNELLSFFYDGRSHLGVNPLPPEFISFCELFCAATHGSTVGYQEAALEGPKPMMKHERNAPVLNWGLERLQESILAFASAISDRTDCAHADIDLRPCLARALLTLVNTPSPEEAHVFGAFPFENDQAGADVKPFAAPIGFSQVVRSLIRGSLVSDQSVLWKAGSLQLSSAATRETGKLFLRAKHLQRRVRNKLSGVKG